MRDTISEKLQIMLLNGIPLLSSLLLIFLSFMPLNSLQLSYFRPVIGFICIYYWTLKRGDLFGYTSAFIIGFITDIYSSSPLGVNIMLMMSEVAMTAWISRYFQSSVFSTTWLIFSFICLGFTLLKWILLMIYSGRVLHLSEIIFSCFSTIMFYPLIAFINSKIQDNFLPQEYIDE